VVCGVLESDFITFDGRTLPSNRGSEMIIPLCPFGYIGDRAVIGNTLHKLLNSIPSKFLSKFPQKREQIYITIGKGRIAINIDYTLPLKPLRIKAIEANQLYISEIAAQNPDKKVEYKLVREWHELSRINERFAVINDSLFLRYMAANTASKLTRYADDSCFDFMMLKFNYPAEYWIGDDEQEQPLSAEEKQKQSKRVMPSTLRKKYYMEGFDFTHTKYKKTGELVTVKTVRYKMLMRSPGKAKAGECMFIREEIYDKAIKFLTMGLYEKMLKRQEEDPNAFFNIVGLSAYQTLTTADAIGYIQIPLDNILILKDIEVESAPLPAAVVSSVEVKMPQKKYQCQVNYSEEKIKNVLYDGMGLIDDSWFPDGMSGFIYCRSHFFKSCLFCGSLERFFRDYCAKHGLDYDTYTVTDMFGNKVKISDVKVIITDKSLKWLKFVDFMGGTQKKAYKQYKRFMENAGNYFSIVKTAHKSKWGGKQLTTYQMNNTLPTVDQNVLSRITQPSAEYYLSLKDDANYLDYLRITKSNFNINELLVDLVNRNPKIIQTRFYKNKKKKDLTKLKAEFKEGRLLQSGDNMTIMDNPVALLRYAVGDPEPLKEDCFEIIDDGVQCYTTRFADGASLAAFRSPHNSPNNIIHLRNIYAEPIRKYFPNIGDNVIVFNAIGTDTQPRLSGHDVDSDFVLVTDQRDMAELAAYAYKNYPTIINDVKEVDSSNSDSKKNAYHLEMEDYARMDNKISDAQAAIGISTDTAQLALSHYFHGGMKDKNLINYVVILSVIGQISIDLAKKEFVIGVMQEIKRIKGLESMQCINRVPEFFAETKKSRNNTKILTKEELESLEEEKKNRPVREELNCPMDIMGKLITEQTRSYALRTSVTNIRDLITKKTKKSKVKNRYSRDKFLDAVEQYRNKVRELKASTKDKDSKAYHQEWQWIENSLVRSANKGLDECGVRCLVNIATKDENSDICNTILLFLYKERREELLNCFVENIQK